MNAAYVIVALPLAGAVVLGFVGRRFGDPLAGWLATVLSFGSFAATVVTWHALIGRLGAARSVHLNIFTWIPVDALHLNFSLLVDPLSMTMALFVTGVGSLIHLYSIGYMKADPDYPRFFFYLNLFLFSMLVLVLADSYLFSFLGWEGVGFCSYGMIGFWFERNSAAVAAKKAFVTNRIGDVGFMIALFLMFGHFGSFAYTDVLSPLMGAGAHLAGVTATGLGLMLLLGACGKSAQLPLYMWLPDAMEGPTPVSALIHAATMVTAGVYLMARSAPILHFSYSTQWAVAVVGAATAIFAATIACGQDDIKRVLAYSTLSQLGYMFLGIGSGGYTAGLFHMITHAFFKALLFLAAGAVIHALRDEQDMKKMGALRRYLPITFPTFVVGYLALSAIPPFAGFWSKDDILVAAWHMSPVLWAVGAVTAGLTAYYMSRLMGLVFFGGARWGSPVGVGRAATEEGGAGAEESHRPTEGHGDGGRPHESPWVMTLPLVVLAILSSGGWLLNAPFGSLDKLDRFLAPLFPASIAPAIHVATNTKWVLGGVTVGLSLVGLVLGLAAWRTPVHPRLEPSAVRHGWYIDEAVSATVSGPLAGAAEGLAFGVDAALVDGGVNGVARLTAGTGRQLRRIQTGYVRTYALGFAGGVAVLLLYMAVRMGS
ncbi:MAG: NADH-quinone oxidoreductase subunit L [Acidimicrobiales bacterium]